MANILVGRDCASKRLVQSGHRSLRNEGIMDEGRIMDAVHDVDPLETGEWLDAIQAVIEAEGIDRAHFLLENLTTKARELGAFLPYNANTPYVNTIPLELQPRYPGDREIERRISSIIRWNAAAIVLRANKEHAGLGGHIASFQSAATLYDVGFNH